MYRIATADVDATYAGKISEASGVRSDATRPQYPVPQVPRCRTLLHIRSDNRRDPDEAEVLIAIGFYLQNLRACCWRPASQLGGSAFRLQCPELQHCVPAARRLTFRQGRLRRWVQQQNQEKPAELWSEGVEDYISHAQARHTAPILAGLS